MKPIISVHFCAKHNSRCSYMAMNQIDKEIKKLKLDLDSLQFNDFYSQGENFCITFLEFI